MNNRNQHPGVIRPLRTRLPQSPLKVLSLLALLALQAVHMGDGLLAADPPALIPFQGHLARPTATNPNKFEPVPSGQYDILFTLYAAPAGGESKVWGPERHTKVVVVDGVLNAMLGSVIGFSDALAANPNFLGRPLYVGIIIVADGNPNTPDLELVPRQVFLPAVHALNATKLNGADWRTFFDGTDDKGAFNPGATKAKNATVADHALNADRALISDTVANGAIGTAQLADGSVTSAKFGGGLTLTSGAFTSSITQKSSTAPRHSLQFLNQRASVTYEAFTFLSNGSTQPMLTILANSNVGIGTSHPTQAQLVVDNKSPSSVSSGGWYYYNGGIIEPLDNTLFSDNVSIFCTKNILSLAFLAMSDSRINNILGVSDSAADLKTLLGLQITDYSYKDIMAHGSKPQTNVIAQQVATVFPQAVSKSTDVVPDIFEKAEMTNGWAFIKTDLLVGEHVKIIGEHQESIQEVLEVKNGAFRTAFQPANGRIYVYGREVKDSENVDYSALSMLNISATQELARRQEMLEAKAAQVTALQRQVADLSQQAARVDTLEQQIASLTKMVTQLAAADKTPKLMTTRLDR